MACDPRALREHGGPRTQTKDDLNLYAYVYNDPIDKTDPSGTSGPSGLGSSDWRAPICVAIPGGPCSGGGTPQLSDTVVETPQEPRLSEAINDFDRELVKGSAEDRKQGLSDLQETLTDKRSELLAQMERIANGDVPDSQSLEVANVMTSKMLEAEIGTLDKGISDLADRIADADRVATNAAAGTQIGDGTVIVNPFIIRSRPLVNLLPSLSGSDYFRALIIKAMAQ